MKGMLGFLYGTLCICIESLANPHSSDYQGCILSVLEILKYSIRKSQNYMVKGWADDKILHQLSSDLHHLNNAIHNPFANIYQYLNIEIPTSSAIKYHKSGIYDEEFITFQLQQIMSQKNNNNKI